MITVANIDFEAGQHLPLHEHAEGQILFARSGTLEVITESKLYLLPPSRAAWVPPYKQHALKFRTRTELRTAYVPTSMIPDFIPSTRIIQVSDLFKALLLRLVEEESLDAAFRQKLADLMLAELRRLPSEHFYLVMPTDKRARKVAHELVQAPSDRRKLENWADIANCSAKTLSRLFSEQTGQTFQLWRRQAKLLAALDHLDAGKSVTETAHDVGFSTSSAFTEAFRITFGYPPTKR